MVTGANYLLEVKSDEGRVTRILVDCGLHQGSNFCERHNWEPFPYNPKDIAAVFVTHAHIDHIGRLPKLYKDGFRGAVYSTPPTRDAGEFLLADSDHILAEEAKKFKNPILFTHDDITGLMRLWQGISYHETVTAGPFSVTLMSAGHILGSSFIVVEAEGKRIVFSGDLGNTPAPLIGPKEILDRADYCVVESTYGDRIHERAVERKEILEDLIEDTVHAKGTLVIPAFAMERTQELLYEIDDLAANGRVPRVPIFIDSPLAIRLTEVYRKYESGYFNEAVEGFIKSAGDLFKFPGLKLTETTEESKKINDVPPPKIVIAGSGMSHGGRILHHERRYLPDPKSTLLIVGYQGQGSLGRQILDGAGSVRIFGEEVPVRCKIKAIGGYSAHADQPQLLAWLEPMRFNLRKVFVVQGEEPASAALAQKIVDELAIPAAVPALGEEVVI